VRGFAQGAQIVFSRRRLGKRALQQPRCRVCGAIRDCNPRSLCEAHYDRCIAGGPYVQKVCGYAFVRVCACDMALEQLAYYTERKLSL
jgi:hypothetical protein